MAEFAVSGELEETCTCVGEIDAGLRWAAISEVVSDAIERKENHRVALGACVRACARVFSSFPFGALSVSVRGSGVFSS